jgi:FKBP-type peptidyl-prolyl cis-trans isomerase FklB
MTRLSTGFFVAILSIGPALWAQNPTAPPPKPPKTVLEQGSYGIGLQIGRNLRQSLKAQELNFDAAMLARGLVDALTEKKPALTEQELAAAMEKFEQLADSRRADTGAKNLQEGAAFLAANKKKPGIKTLPSGLQYKVLKSGNGPSPKATDRVKTHYHGTLIDGTVFDSSVERREPASFEVNRVIRGWTEALQLMKVGDKWQLFIPSELAYGASGAGGVIGPNATLIFEVELLDIDN